MSGLMFNPTSKDNAIVAAYRLARLLRVKVTRRTLEETLGNHPDYSSLLSLSDAFDEWKVDNAALQLDKNQLAEVPVPFLAYLTVDKGMFAVVRAVSGNSVEWLHTGNGWRRESVAEFLGKWTGAVLLAEPSDESGEKDYASNRRKDVLESVRIPFLAFVIWVAVVSALCLAFGGGLQADGWNLYGLLLVKLAGVAVCSLLLWHQIDRDNGFIKSLCQLGGKSGCASILDSKAANLFTWLSWSEIGFFYFSGGCLALLLGIHDPAITVFLIALNLLALPFTLYSLYYQAVVARQLCVLCLAVQVSLVLEFACGFGLWQSIPTGFDFRTIGILLSAFSVPVAGWVFVKPFLLAARKVEPLENDLRKFRNNPELFSIILKQQPAMPIVDEDMGAMVLGNPDAGHAITIVTNPYCQPCAKTHAEMEELLAGNSNLKCRIIFAASNDEGDARGEVARYILSLPVGQQGAELHAWFTADREQKDEMRKRMIANPVSEKAAGLLEWQQSWCKRAEIKATPTIYIGQHRKPDLYGLADLKHILKHLPGENMTAEEDIGKVKMMEPQVALAANSGR